ncbi:MAG: HNH endonuclease, partial [Chloroflexota bacterium]
MNNVLLLNASYEPLGVISPQRAFLLMLAEKVYREANDVIALRSVSRDFEIPTVVRLKMYVNVPRRKTRWSRRGVLKRDGFICIYCGAHAGAKATLDHIIPRSLGGKDTWVNTACACVRCNQRKGNRTPAQAGMKLHWEPKIPRVDYLVASSNIPQSWKVYLEMFPTFRATRP